MIMKILSAMLLLVLGTTVFTVTSISRTIVIVHKYETDKLVRILSSHNLSLDESHRIARSIKLASRETGIPELLIFSLMKTESSFRRNAVSKKNYKGLMQTPKATFDYAEVDVLYGAMILKEKLRLANNDLKLALALYKGGNNKLAHKQAAEVIEIYDSYKKGG